MSYLVPQTLEPSFPPGTSRQENNPLMETLMVLSSSIQAKIQMALSDLYTLINSHPFFVLFEARLACNSQTDHTVARSVLPVFQDEFMQLFASLQAEILRDLEPYLQQLTQETAVCWRGENSGILKKFKQIQLENASTKTKIMQLEAEKKDNTTNYQSQLKKLQNEILQLKEMLFQQKRIGMPIYKPDYEGEFSVQKDKMEIFTKKQHDDIITEIQQKNQKQLDKLEKDYKTQVQQIIRQLGDERAENQQLKQQILDLQNQLSEIKIKGESDAQKTGQEYESLFVQLQQAIQEANAKTKAEQDKYEDIIAAKDAKIAELEAMLRSQRLEIDRLNGQIANNGAVQAQNSARNQKEQPDAAAELAQIRDMNKRLQEALDDTLRGKQYVEEAYRVLKEQLDQMKLDHSAKQKILDAETNIKFKRAIDQQSTFSLEIDELKAVLQGSREAYDNLRKTSNALFSSLFHLENGGITRMLRVKDPRFSPYEQLKADTKRQNLTLDSLKELARSLQLVKEWCALFCPDAPVQDDRQFMDILALNQKLNSGADNMSLANGQILQVRSAQAIQNIQAPPVNSVILHPSLLSDQRVDNGRTSDIGINTSICASLEDGFHQHVMVDKSVMYECSACSASRSNSRVCSRAGSAFQRESAVQEQSSACTIDSRPGSAAFQNAQSAAQYGYQGVVTAGEHTGALIGCPACGKSSQIGRIEIMSAGNKISAVNISHECASCGAKQNEANITCPACSKVATATNIDVYGQDSDGSVEYFAEDDFVKPAKSDLKVNELDQAVVRKRPQSGVARTNSESRIVRPQTAGPVAQHPDQSNTDRQLAYTCPHCNARSVLGGINLISGYPQFIYDTQNVYPNKNRGQSAPAYQHQTGGYQFQPSRAGAYSASHYTQFQTDGTVFDRLLNRAKQLEDKFNRKRDLLLQERKRTTERVLRSLSLFIENFPPQEQGIYSTQTVRLQASKNAGTASQAVKFSTAQVSMRFSSPVKAFMRPQSSKIDEVAQIGKKMFRNRPMSGGATRSQGRQESVLELLAASGVLKK